MDDYEDHLFLVLKMILINIDTRAPEADQISFVLGRNYLVTFLERPSDVFLPAVERLQIDKSRIRRNGPDYLLYTLVDIIVDNYFAVIDKGSEILEGLEGRVITGARTETLIDIQKRKRDFIFLRKSISPLRDVLLTIDATACWSGDSPTTAATWWCGDGASPLARRRGAPPPAAPAHDRARGRRALRAAAAQGLRGRLRRDDGRDGRPRGRHRPRRPRAGHPRAVRPARERGRCADHPPDQRAADAGGEGERVRHPHRAVREPPGGPLSRRRRAARGAADQARGRAADRLAHQGHVASSTSPRSACRRTAASSLRIAGRAVDVRVSTIPSGHGERVVLRLLDKQAGPARPRLARHGSERPRR